MKKDKNIKFVGKNYDRVVSIDPSKKNAAFCIWEDGSIFDYGPWDKYETMEPIFGERVGLLIIEDQVLAKNFQSSKDVAEDKAVWMNEAEKRGYAVAEVHPSTWVAAIGCSVSAKTDQRKFEALRFANMMIAQMRNKPRHLTKKEQDIADAICIGQTFIDKYKVTTNITEAIQVIIDRGDLEQDKENSEVAPSSDIVRQDVVVTRELFCEFSIDEFLQRCGEYSKLTKERSLAMLELDKARLKYGGSIKSLTVRIDKMSEEVGEKGEKKDVDCHWYFDYRKWEKRLITDDTHVIVESEAMSQAEQTSFS